MAPRARTRTNRRDTITQEDTPALIRIQTIFNDVQVLRNTVTHSSYHARLFEVHRKMLRDAARGQTRFLNLFTSMTSTLLKPKKGETVVDRTIQFVAGYPPYVQGKQAELRQDRRQERNEEDTDSDSDDEYAPAEHLKEGLMRFLVEGFESKDEAVRFRVVQLVSQLLVSGLDELEDNIFHLVKKGLTERLEDKKVPVRVQACIGLCKLYPNEQPREFLNGVSLKQQLLDKLESDTSPDVRRAILNNLSVNEDIIDNMLLRLRDEDVNTRKFAYRTVLPRHMKDSNTENGLGFLHPRALRIAQRERIILDGLGDRDSVVVQEATNLIVSWVQELTGPDSEGGQPTNPAILELLKLLDLREEKAASMALKAIFGSRLEIFGGIVFPDTYWLKPTEEEAFLARVYMEYCVAENKEAMIEAKFPTATALALHIQHLYNTLLPESIEEAEIIDVDETDEERERKEDEQIAKQFVFGEMLKLAEKFDYGDEQGRRDMSKLTTSMLQQTISLPDELNLLCLDMLRRVAFDNRDFVRQVVEIVSELTEEAEPEEEEVKAEEDGDNSFDSTSSSPARATKPPRVLTPQQYQRIKTTKLRCLKLVIGLLERIHGRLEDNSSLGGIQQDLIVKAVMDIDPELREKGIIALSLCCLLSKKMVSATLVLFRNEVLGERTPENIKVIMLKGIFDMMMIYEGAIMTSVEEAMQTIDMLTTLLEDEDSSDELREITITGLCKLVNAGVITDPKVVMNLLMAFFSPATIENQVIQQTLSFFFYYYSHTSENHQRVLGRVCVPVLHELGNIRETLDYEQEMHPVQTIVNMVLLWTAPSATATETNKGDGLVHFELAQEIAKAMLGGQIRGEQGLYDFDKEHIKEFSQALANQIQLPDNLDELQAYTLHTLISKVNAHNFHDKTVDRLVGKFLKAITEKYTTQLQSMTEEEARKREQLAALFEFVDSIFDDDEEEDVKPVLPRAGRKRRSTSMSTVESESDVKQRKRIKTSKRRPSSDDSDSDTSSVVEVQAPTRRQPARRATKKPPADAEVIVISSDSGEDKDSDTPVPKIHGKAYARKKRQVEELDEEIDGLLDPQSTPPATSPTPSPPPTVKPPRALPRPRANSLFGDSDGGSEAEVVNDLLEDDSD